jgi:metallo-beta-lactamase family protein
MLKGVGSLVGLVGLVGLVSLFMKITFCGADKGVTGSCHLLQINKQKILIDCGMFQGSDFNEGKNFEDFPFDSKELSAVLVTHAHLDHIGRLPKLVKEGFNKKIYMLKGTIELAELIWRDAFEIMNYNHRKFQEPLLFDTADIAATLELCHGVNYHEPLDLEGVEIVWKDAGHIFGSAFLEIRGEGKLAIFSGDIGNINEPIVKDTELISTNADVLVCESTYGDRLHEAVDVRRSMILELFIDAFKKGGTLMIPAFSLERTQELLYDLNHLSEVDKVLPPMPIFLDSPLAIDANKVYGRYPEYYDAEATTLHKLGDDFLKFSQLKITYTKEQSMEINKMRGPKVVIAGAGMMNGGRILHHAFRYLSDPNSTLLIIGYQAQGTLGRKLYEGAKQVKIFREEVSVNCTIKAIGALSAHGDQKKLLEFVGSAEVKPKKVFCVHGEITAVTALAGKIKEQYGIETYVPGYGETIEI